MLFCLHIGRKIVRSALQSFVTLDLCHHFNNDGISYASNRCDGSFNVWGNTFPAEALPLSLSIVDIAGVPFLFPPKEDGLLNNMSCFNQEILVEPARYDWLYLLAASERRSEDLICLHYEQKRLEYARLRVSDFWPETPPRFGEVEAFRCPSLHYPHHTQSNMKPVIWRQQIGLADADKLVQMTLPDNIAIHIFALTLHKIDEGDE